jgi:hypothetical protein
VAFDPICADSRAAANMKDVRAEPALKLESARPRASTRTKVVLSVGPLTLLAGVIWGLAQPDRLTFLHPHGQGFWWLAVEPPLLVVLVGVLFSAFVAPGLIEDLEDLEDAS